MKESVVTIQQCKYILKIAETGSFNEAAKQLFVAQSSLSASVKLIEGELGIRIFERSKNGVFLTAEGAEFTRYARQLSEQNDFIIRRYTSDTHKKRLYVCTQHYDFVADVFCRLLRETEDDYSFSLKETHTYDVITEVESAHSDIGILAIKDNDLDLMMRYLSNKGLCFTDMITVSPHVFLRRGHPLADRRVLSPEDISSFPYLSYEQGEHSTSFFTEEASAPPAIGKHVSISDRATLMNVLLTTDCYTVGTGIMPSALNAGKIVSVPYECKISYHIGHILRADRQASEITERLIELIRDFFVDLKK